MLVVAVFAAFLSTAEPTRAGGVPSSVLLIGANGAVRDVTLTVALGDALYAGQPRGSPPGGYLRMFPLFADTPGLDGRYYPTADVVCFEPPHPGCHDARPAVARQLDATSKGLARLHGQPGVIDRLRSGGRNVPGQVRIAVQLALAQTGRVVAEPHGDVVKLSAAWRGTGSSTRPRQMELEPAGVYAVGRLYPLPRVIWTTWGARLIVHGPFRLPKWHATPTRSRSVVWWFVVLAALSVLAATALIAARRRGGHHIRPTPS